MSENGNNHRTNIWSEVAGQVSDQVELASLELRYEAANTGRKLLAGAVILVLVLTGFIVLQVALVGALMKVGVSLGMAAFLFSSLYFLLAFAVYWKFARRDPRAGAPFASSQKELQHTIRWIQKILS